MKLYLISNASKFKGSVHAVYKDGLLCKVDFSNTDLQATAIQRMLTAVSPEESSVGANFKNGNTVIVEGDFEISFEDFKREYPYKRNTHLAQAYWSKLRKDEQAMAFIAATDYRKYLERTEWQSPMIPDKWLKQKQFLNDWKTL